ncbi:MAG: nuclear transport factor 2 family protein, partial [Gammaproteobacteria bacterium]|nr:nuclear transport factor 2 family protein [Gammaproteobacteria bacterium]
MTNTEIVLAFIDAWNTMNWDSAADLLSDDTVWHNIPMEKIEGKAVVEAAIRGMGPESVDWEVIS